MKPVVRAITGFVNLVTSDLSDNADDLDTKVATCAILLRKIQQELEKQGYVVQTSRLATNPFGEWLILDDHQITTTNAISSNDSQLDNNAIKKRLHLLDTILSKYEINFCSLGPAMNMKEASVCCDIVSLSSRLSCSMNVNAGDVKAADAAADIIQTISKLGNKSNAPQHLTGGLGNFQFCAASNCKPFIPFFPAAKSSTSSENNNDGLKFAIGLENGPVIQSILHETRSVANIGDHFANEYAKILLPIQTICETIAKKNNEADFLGIDNSLNPSLETCGSIAAALEQLEEVSLFGGPGTTSATAQLTVALQSLPGIKLTGYCGVMLPVCEDTRLADLTKEGKRKLQISDLLLISTVCGVGLDTIPLPGDCPQTAIRSMILDVAGVAGRWNKSLSCRLLPVPGLKAGEMTQFESPYLINAQVFSVD